MSGVAVARIITDGKISPSPCLSVDMSRQGANCRLVRNRFLTILVVGEKSGAYRPGSSIAAGSLKVGVDPDVYT